MVAALAAFAEAVLPPLPVVVAVPVLAVTPAAVPPVAVFPAVVPPAAVPPVVVPVFEEGPGVCVGPEPLPPPQYGAQGLLSVA